MTQIKYLINLHQRDNLEFNEMSNKLLNKDFSSLLDMHINGNKTESLTSYSALVKLYPFYKFFCYPETYLKQNDLFICKENIDYVRAMALFNLIAEFPEINEFCNFDIKAVENLQNYELVDWPTIIHKTQTTSEIEEMKEEINFIQYVQKISKTLNQ